MAKAALNKKEAPARTMLRMAEQSNKGCGKGTVIRGTELLLDPARIPTGVFAVDYATGGGLPLWQSSCFWGPESGGKTSLALNAAATVPRICWKCFQPLKYCTCSQGSLKMRTYWADVEGTFDRRWAASIGAKPEDYFLGMADYAEQHINVAHDMMQSDDCGLVVIDSLAALIPVSEMDADMEDQFMGLQARLIGRMVRKLKQQVVRERKREHPCSLLFINQMRMKIGVMFGNPETQPGGHGLRHEFSLLLRCAKQSLGGDKSSASKKMKDSARGFNSAEKFAFTIKKFKVQTLTGLGEYFRAVEPIPDLALKQGHVDDTRTILMYAKQYGIVRKEGSKLYYFDTKAESPDQIRSLWNANAAERLRTHQAITTAAKIRLRKEGLRSAASVNAEEPDAE